ncbi:EAL domain-containing protein [Fredinandcohnia humi]
MKKYQINTFIKFLKFLKTKRYPLYQEFMRNEELKELMKNSKIKTVYQPILSLVDGSTVGFEILNRPETTVQFPTTENFYDFVGRSSYVFMVERFLRNLSLERYAEQVRDLQVYKEQLVFLNIQSQVLADPDYRSGITLELLAKYNLSPNQIVLELTEKQAVLNNDQFKKMIEHYRRQGFRIAVDDAGTGYNSLQTLVYIKPEFIKLDKTLIRNIGEHKEQQHLVELLVKYAFQVGTTVIAEGIETKSEYEYVKKLGVHMGQGYGLGKPMPDLANGNIPMTNFLNPLALIL